MDKYSFKLLGELPLGYEYKIFQVTGIVKIIGIHPDKEPIGFILNETRIEKMELD